MEVAVVGGTGTFGRILVGELDRRDHAVRVLSRTPHEEVGAAHHRVDLSTGAGLREALTGVEVVVDASNSGGGKKVTQSVMIDGTARLLAAEAHAEVDHHVLISIVGIEGVPVSYYRAKVEQERLVREAEVQASVMRATQFHQLIDMILGSFARFRVMPRSSLRFQPIDPREVAMAMADAIGGGPWPGHLEIAGPEVRTLGELAGIWSSAAGRRFIPVPIPPLGSAATAVRGGALCAPGARRGSLTFERWLDQRGVPDLSPPGGATD